MNDHDSSIFDMHVARGERERRCIFFDVYDIPCVIIIYQYYYYNLLYIERFLKQSATFMLITSTHRHQGIMFLLHHFAKSTKSLERDQVDFVHVFINGI